MPRILIYAASDSQKEQFVAEKLKEADPKGVVFLTADFTIDEAAALLENMLNLTDDVEEVES